MRRIGRPVLTALGWALVAGQALAAGGDDDANWGFFQFVCKF